MIENSKNQTEIKMSEPIHQAMMELREFMFNTVYLRPAAQKEINKAKHVVTALIEYYLNHPKEMPETYINLWQEWGLETAVIDYISGMTDVYAVEKYQELFIPKKYDVV